MGSRSQSPPILTQDLLCGKWRPAQGTVSNKLHISFQFFSLDLHLASPYLTQGNMVQASISSWNSFSKEGITILVFGCRNWSSGRFSDLFKIVRLGEKNGARMHAQAPPPSIFVSGVALHPSSPRTALLYSRPNDICYSFQHCLSHSDVSMTGQWSIPSSHYWNPTCWEPACVTDGDHHSVETSLSPKVWWNRVRWAGEGDTVYGPAALDEFEGKI